MKRRSELQHVKPTKLILTFIVFSLFSKHEIRNPRIEGFFVRVCYCLLSNSCWMRLSLVWRIICIVRHIQPYSCDVVILLVNIHYINDVYNELDFCSLIWRELHSNWSSVWLSQTPMGNHYWPPLPQTTNRPDSAIWAISTSALSGTDMQIEKPLICRLQAELSPLFPLLLYSIFTYYLFEQFFVTL